MKKTLVVIFVLGILFSLPSEVWGYFGYGFGGRIISLNDNVPEIIEAKADGFTCTYTGELIQVQPSQKDALPVTYYAVSTSQKTTRSSLRYGQGIIGLYFRPSPVICVKSSGGKIPIVKAIPIKSIVIFGTSR